MKYDELLRAGRIRRERVSKAEVRRALELAERDLAVARSMMSQARDWAFAIGYNAALQASRALMFSQGFRPASVHAHRNTLAFMQLALGTKHKSLVTYLDRARRKRHRAVYDQAGLITEKEAANLLGRAEEFVALVQRRLQRTGD